MSQTGKERIPNSCRQALKSYQKHLAKTLAKITFHFLVGRTLPRGCGKRGRGHFPRPKTNPPLLYFLPGILPIYSATEAKAFTVFQ